MEQRNSSEFYARPWVKIVRWILFFPAALIGSVLVFALFRLVSAFGVRWATGSDPSSMWLAQRAAWYVCTEVMPSFVFGVALVYIGCKVAPHSERVVAGILAGFALVMTGISLAFNLMTGEWSGVDLVIASTVGSVILAQ